MKRSKHCLSLLCLIMLASCDPPSAPIKSGYEMICSRHLSDPPVYQIRVPEHWKRKDLSEIVDKSDTKLPICEFSIDDIRITIHSFPSQYLEDRIPPTAQVERWKKQFGHLDSFSMTPQAFSGYSGLLFEGEGLINKEQRAMLGWTMQLASEHYRLLNNPEQKADFTIKAVGPVDQITQHKKEIMAFARSFELVDEIPEQL